MIENPEERGTAEDVKRSIKAITRGARGVLCYCTCYKEGTVEIYGEHPLHDCLLLVPTEIYERLERWTTDKNRAHNANTLVAVVWPGIIRVRWQKNPRDNYWLEQDLCKCQRVDTAIKVHLGKKVRLGRNILVK